jgi:two-component system cell cycle sensor histidine kinase/response regulator CckA
MSRWQRWITTSGKDLEQRLRACEDLYHGLFEENPLPIWVYDASTLRFLDANRAAEERYGYSKDEFLAMRLTDIGWQAASGAAASPADNAPNPEAGGTSPGAWRHQPRPEGGIDGSVVSHPFTYRGRPARVAIAQDITDRFRTLRDSEERLRFALHASGVGVWDTDLTTGVSYWSEKCEVMHGLAPGTFGRTLGAFMDRIHPDDRPRVRQTIDDAVQQHRDAQLEYRTTWPDGTERQIVSTARFFYDDTGKPVRGAGVALDLTERRSLEAQLRQAQKMEAVGQLAGGIAHDFNNMLTAILGNAELMGEDLAPDTRHRFFVDEIVAAANGAAALTRQLLAFSRKQVLAPIVLHMGDVVGEVSPLLRRVLGESIDMKAVISNAGRVKADPGQMQQVLVNLAVNARDAMPGGGRLTIETADVFLDERYARQHPGARPGEHVMLAVSDTGHGMDADTQRRIFEPFFTTKAKGHGTGLGLATVYGIVKQSGGHIWVYSEVGHGTTFKVYFPRTTVVAAPRERPRVDPRSLRGAETIVLVEDEEVVRRFTSTALTQYGYTVHVFATGGRALEFAEKATTPVHLVVTDVVLPDMNGRDVASRIQQQHPDASVLYMSGYTDDAIVRHGVLDEGVWFLEKPFSAEGLGAKVREVLGAGRGRSRP